MNTVTPRLFMAATQQNAGKTTVALGLFAALQSRLGRIGFIKPVGQRFVDVEGSRIDEDSLLIQNTYRVQIPIEAMSPIAVEPDFTRRYIEHANDDLLVKRIQNSFDRSCWEKEFVIVEGTGHAGVGAVFDLSNARVAKLLGCKVILVTEGGIGRPIDEVALNKALFDQEGVEIIGVVLNKVRPEKAETVQEFARRGFARLGIELLGIMPSMSVLADPTLHQVCEQIGGTFINGKEKMRRRVRNVIIGAMNSAHMLSHFRPGTLVITPGDREDVVLAALSATTLDQPPGEQLAGIILSGDLQPHPSVLKLIQSSSVPILTSAADSYSVARSIHSMTIKTLPGDTERIETIEKLIALHVNVDRILEKVAQP